MSRWKLKDSGRLTEGTREMIRHILYNPEYLKRIARKPGIPYKEMMAILAGIHKEMYVNGYTDLPKMGCWSRQEVFLQCLSYLGKLDELHSSVLDKVVGSRLIRVSKQEKDTIKRAPAPGINTDMIKQSQLAEKYGASHTELVLAAGHRLDGLANALSYLEDTNTPKEAQPMKFTTIDYINGDDITQLSDDILLGYIQKEQKRLKDLRELAVESKSVDNKIATHEDNIKRLIEILDSRVEE